MNFGIVGTVAHERIDVGDNAVAAARAGKHVVVEKPLEFVLAVYESAQTEREVRLPQPSG